MNIDSIQNGVVLDHIQAGKSMDIYRYLHLDELDCSVAIIKNVRSGRMGKKDIIKIDSPMEVDLDVLGYIDPNITVNIIRNGVRVEKKHLELPRKLVNIIHCKNPRCITVSEPQLDAKGNPVKLRKPHIRCPDRHLICRDIPKRRPSRDI